MMPCALKSIFGIDCPICGFQRSFLLLLQGNFIESFKAYPPLIFALVLIVYAVATVCFPRYIGRKFLPSYSLIVLIIIAINYSVKIATGNLF
jgi:hypothetical protein